MQNWEGGEGAKRHMLAEIVKEMLLMIQMTLLQLVIIYHYSFIFIYYCDKVQYMKMKGFMSVRYCSFLERSDITEQIG